MAPTVGVDDVHAPVCQPLGQEAASGLENGRVEFDARHVGHAVLQDFIGGAGERARDEQYVAGRGALGHCDVRDFLRALDLATREQRQSVFDEVQLAGGFGHHEASIGRLGAEHDPIGPALPGGGEGVGIKPGGAGDQRCRQREGQDSGSVSGHPPKSQRCQEQVGCRWHQEQGKVIQPPDQSEREQRAPDHAAQAISQVRPRRASSRIRFVGRPGRQREEDARGEAVRGEDEQAAPDRLIQAERCAAEEDGIASEPDCEKLGEGD